MHRRSSSCSCATFPRVSGCSSRGWAPRWPSCASCPSARRSWSYLIAQGFGERFLRYLSRFRFTGDIDAIPEGTIAFAN